TATRLSAIARLREGELEERDEARALGAQTRVDGAFRIALGQSHELVAQGGELVRGQVEHRVAERRRAAPFRRLLRQPIEPGERALEVALRDQLRQELRCGREIGVVRDLRPARVLRGRAPGALAAAPAARLLGEAVLRQLPQVKRAAGRALTDLRAGLRRRERTLPAQEPDQRQPERVRDGAKCSGVGELDSFRCRHISKHTFRKESLNSRIGWHTAKALQFGRQRRSPSARSCWFASKSRRGSYAPGASPSQKRSGVTPGPMTVARYFTPFPGGLDPCG